MTYFLNATSYTTSHLLYDGHDGWIEAKKVWLDPHHPELDGARAGWGWEFKCAEDCVRWLRA